MGFLFCYLFFYLEERLQPHNALSYKLYYNGFDMNLGKSIYHSEFIFKSERINPGYWTPVWQTYHLLWFDINRIKIKIVTSIWRQE